MKLGRNVVLLEVSIYIDTPSLHSFPAWPLCKLLRC